MLTKTQPAERLYPGADDGFFKVALREATRDSLFFPVTLGEAHEIRVKKNFNTACWAFRPPHNIFVGLDLFQKPNLKKNLSQEAQSLYIQSHVHHELAHAMYTERDFKATNKLLSSIKVAFSLYNLFEDSRIEHRYRKETGYLFRWLEIETLPEEMTAPGALFFSLIQAEGKQALVEKAFKAKLKSLPEEEATEKSGLFDEVLEFYRRAIACDNSHQLMPILRDWVQRFGSAKSDFDKDDLGTGVKLAQDPKAFSEFMQGTQSLSADDNDDGEDPSPGKGERDSVSVSASSGKNSLLGTARHVYDVARASAIASKFLSLFKVTTRRVSTLTPTKKVSARHFALGRPAFRKNEQTARTSKKQIMMVVDCSGSMGGFHIDEGRILVAALSDLARQGHVSGQVILSGVVNGTASWTRFELPMKQADIEKIHAFAGAEGLEFTIRDNAQFAQKADYVFVYTDGQICDAPINKAKLHRQGIYTWGLYTGETTEYQDELLEFFDKAVIRSTVEELVDAMLAQL